LLSKNIKFFNTQHYSFVALYNLGSSSKGRAQVEASGEQCVEEDIFVQDGRFFKNGLQKSA
jgi:hypothetical protein